MLEVEYIITQGIIPPSSPKTHATYHYTTGDISKKEENFKIGLDNSTLPDKIKYGIDIKNTEKFIELTRHDLVITRLIIPEGYVLPVESIVTIAYISREYSGFTKYGEGSYEIQVTYGNKTSKPCLIIRFKVE